MRLTAVPFLILAALTSGWHTDVSAQPLPDHAQAVLDDIGRMSFRDAEMAAGGLSEGEIRERKERRRQFRRDLLPHLLRAQSFADALPRADSLLALDRYADDLVLRQASASALLKGHVIPERAEIRPEDALDIERVATMLMESGSPEVYTLLRTLDALERADLTDARQRLLDRLPVYLAAHADTFVGCFTCTPPEARPGPFEGAPPEYSATVATERLRALAAE